MDDKKLKLEKLKTAREKIDNKINELEEAQIEELEIEENEDTDDVIEDEVVEDSKNSLKKIAVVASVATVAGAGIFLAFRQPWKTAKIVCHLVHVV